MHRTFKKLLPRAAGNAEWVVAINADIRGFSSRMAGDPAVTGLYLRKVYSVILRDYFRGASFFKPTGDGLLVIVPFPEGRRRPAIAERLVADSLALVEAFPQIATGEQLLPRELPEHLGIGLSAGSTSRIAVGDTTLDYTGPALNIASRLMDLARPSGVVVDSALFLTTLPEQFAERFAADAVYMKGVAETTPLDIHFTADLTSIPERYRKPIVPLERVERAETVTLPKLRDRAPFFIKPLPSPPADRNGIEVEVEYPSYIRGKAEKGFMRIMQYSGHVAYQTRGTTHQLRFDYRPLVKRMDAIGIPRTKSVRIVIRYLTDPNDTIT